MFRVLVKSACLPFCLVYWATVFFKNHLPCAIGLLSVYPVCDVGLLWLSGWTDQDETWHAGRPQRWPHCVGGDPAPPPAKGGRHPIFGPYLLWPNGWMDQDAT